jgi:hypothetical protein
MASNWSVEKPAAHFSEASGTAIAAQLDAGVESLESFRLRSD